MQNKPRNVVGPQVRSFRSREGLSQAALAAKAQRLGWDIGRDAVAKIEGGTRWVADWELLFLAKALSVDPIALFPKNLLPSKR